MVALVPDQAETTQVEPASDEAEPTQIDGVRFLNDEESREYFDRQAHRLLGISGDEFLRRYAAGEYNRELDDRELRGVMTLRMLEDFVR